MFFESSVFQDRLNSGYMTKYETIRSFYSSEKEFFWNIEQKKRENAGYHHFLFFFSTIFLPYHRHNSIR